MNVCGIDVHSSLSEAFQIVGFCPQHDALWEYATTQELLIFFALATGMTAEQALSLSD